MSDLEDFLKRAAQKRQAKAAEQKQAMTPPRRVAPQYSDRRTERMPVPEPEDVALAEVVEETPRTIKANRRSASRKVPRPSSPSVASRSQETSSSGANQSATQPATMTGQSGSIAQDLMTALRQPGGIRQAILMREILDRPEHRW